MSVSWAAMLAFLPFPVSLLGLLWVEPLSLRIALVAAGAALMFVGHLCWVPLRKG